MSLDVMIETYFEHYVLDGGWVMVLLIPLSVVSLALILRGLAVTSNRAIQREQIPAIHHRLEQAQQRQGELRADEAWLEKDSEVLALYSLVAPLAWIAVLAMLLGSLGSVTSFMGASLNVASAGNSSRLAADAERALVPLLWGTAVASISYLAFGVLKLRLYRQELNVIAPAVDSYLAQAKLVTGRAKLDRDSWKKQSDRPGENVGDSGE